MKVGPTVVSLGVLRAEERAGWTVQDLVDLRVVR